MRALLSSLGRRKWVPSTMECCSPNVSMMTSEDVDIPDITVELTLLDHLKERIRLARQIDVQQHQVKKQNHERSWLREAAEAMEIELDSDVVR